MLINKVRKWKLITLLPFEKLDEKTFKLIIYLCNIIYIYTVICTIYLYI